MLYHILVHSCIVSETTPTPRTLSNSESDKEESTDEEAGKIKPVRVKRRKSSSERRRSQPELDLITPGEDSGSYTAQFNSPNEIIWCMISVNQ